MERWFVARTKTGAEVRASVAVAACGFQVFLPVQMVTRAHAGKREQVSRPLFPRYLFVSFDPEAKGHGCINNCRGVANRGLMVSADGDPIAIPNPIIEKIRQRADAMLAKAGEVTTGYQPGEVFQIAVGPFASFEASYMGEDRGKVWALVTLFGRAMTISLDFEAVPPKKSFDVRAA
jgi:transcriptional antiterminator RfaH